MLEDPIYQSLDKRRDISVVRQFPVTRLYRQVDCEVAISDNGPSEPDYFRIARQPRKIKGHHLCSVSERGTERRLPSADSFMATVVV